jgi:HTH-type transcriptional regulator / antitoxin HigA
MKPVKLKVIHNARNYQQALAVLEQLSDAKPGTREHDSLEVLSLLIEDYEKRAFPLEEPDPVSAIQFRLEQMDKQ